MAELFPQFMFSYSCIDIVGHFKGKTEGEGVDKKQRLCY